MLYIAHRINDIDQLKQIPSEMGVEIDIRSNGQDLILQHDPFTPGTQFHEWLKCYHHQLIILNIKEEGLEERILSYLDEFNITNYFFLDQSFPFLVKSARQGQKQIAVRVSEYESIKTVKNLAGQAGWVWIDYFTKFPLDPSEVNELRQLGFQLCVVSPDLQGYEPEIEISKLANLFNSLEIKLDAICTKRPDLWKEVLL
jgi:hypothetical protein